MPFDEESLLISRRVGWMHVQVNDSENCSEALASSCEEDNGEGYGDKKDIRSAHQKP